MLKSVSYTVIGAQRLHCAGCAQRLIRSLGALAGMRQVGADVGKQRIDAQFDSAELDEREIVRRLDLLGYATEPADPPPPERAGRKEDPGAAD